jgi:hypothetical protein
MSHEWILHFLESGQWTVAVAVVMLVVHARVRFNSPPTNRSGTTFAMFFFGLIFYCALIFALWIVVILGVKEGSIGFYKVAVRLGDAADPEALREFRPYAGVVAALVIVVAAQVPWVRRIDDAARAFCIKLAAIPREADRLALELAQTAEFQPKSERLRERITNIITEEIGPQALRFEADGSLAARFTRAVSLYWLFIGPSGKGTQIDFANAHTRSAYTRIMHLSEATAARVVARYRELMQTAAAYFKTPHPDLLEPLNRSIDEVSQLTCGLIARYVLYANATKAKRRQRLARMGFDASRTMVIRFGLDQWVATILAVIVLSAAIMASTPGMRSLSPGQILILSVSFGLTIGCAVMGAVVVAQRFMERHEGEAPGYPPIAELTAAALIVAGLSATIRLGVPLVCVLLVGEASEVPGVFDQFRERLPGLLVPTFCTISLGLLCIYLGARPWSQRLLVAAGAIGNGLSFMAVGALVAAMIDDKVLGGFYLRLEYARLLVVLMSGVTGAAIGAMVLFAFRRSERARRDDAEHAAEIARVSSPGLAPPAATEELEAAPVPRSDIAAQNYGGYSRANAAPLEGRYVCFRPGFVTDVISAYIVDLRWDDTASCLIFEERDRADPEHAQRGRVYMPDGRPFLSFVTVARGAVRVATLSRPDKNGCARGLLMTLSNPAGVNFTPACSPIVLKRVVDRIPQLGFIEANTPDYELYRRELEAVVPKFGLFAPAPGPEPGLALAAE